MTTVPLRAELVVGETVVPADGRREEAPVINPADQTVAGYAPVADAGLVDAAVTSAADAFPDWAARPAAQRAGYLSEIAGWIRSNAPRLARTLTLEQGKPLSESLSEAETAARAFDYYAAEAVRAYGQTIPTDSATLRSLVLRQPFGVVAAITTWNYPLGLMAWKIAPALAAGCTVVAKPAEQTPLAVLDLISGARRAGLPAGVLNSLNGDGDRAGRRLAGDPRVAKISFTGGTQTGKRLLELAARDVKSVTLELGGHTPMIVAPDAPMDLAVADGVKRSFRNAGQLCNSVNRIFVVRSVADEFTSKFAAQAAKLVVGPGLGNPEPDLGPLSSARTRERVEQHVADARAQGGEVLVGGTRPDDERLRDGFYYLPTVVVGGEDMVMLREETFGPVAPILVVEDLDEAIARANALEFGLVCYLYTRDLRTSIESAERLEFGTVNVNNVGGGDVRFPYSGWKQSGLGVELGHEGMAEYLRTKNVRIEIGYR
ncbi:MAG TPA: aldehyde dehydrogenase family protein [Trebonia sp.]|nr:aldehyde dehydrogenase family protein [Trebonia sp.]